MSYGKRNRSVGHKLECKTAKKLRSIGFPNTVTTRSESRSRDNDKIDLMNKDEAENGRLPLDIQCKKLFDEMRDSGNIKVIVHEKTEGVPVKDNPKKRRFVKKGEYVILESSVFFDLLESAKRHGWFD